MNRSRAAGYHLLALLKQDGWSVSNEGKTLLLACPVARSSSFSLITLNEVGFTSYPTTEEIFQRFRTCGYGFLKGISPLIVRSLGSSIHTEQGVIKVLMTPKDVCGHQSILAFANIAYSKSLSRRWLLGVCAPPYGRWRLDAPWIVGV